MQKNKLGNREAADSVTYTPNNLNQYTEVGGVVYSYHGNGNLISDGTNTYTYDEENRLSSVICPLFSAQYTYDAFNRRVSKTVNGMTTYFVYDGDSVIAEHDGNGDLNAEYVHGDAVDEILTMERGGNVYYYFYDGLGSVSEITDNTGAVVENYTYDVYGTPSVIISAIGNPYRFTGQEFDEESGLHHYNRRTYNSIIGRFLQRDPREYEAGMNLFEYAYNSPTNYVDPSGEIAILPVLAIAWAVTEAALSVYDAYATGKTLLDPCASGLEKSATAGLFVLGTLAPGGGYATAGKAVVGKVDDITYLYQKVSQSGKHLKYGITKNPATRYTTEELAGGELKILASGSKKEMLELERDVHKYLPIGPEEGQSVYIQIQQEMGYTVPAY